MWKIRKIRCGVYRNPDYLYNNFVSLKLFLKKRKKGGKKESVGTHKHDLQPTEIKICVSSCCLWPWWHVCPFRVFSSLPWSYRHRLWGVRQAEGACGRWSRGRPAAGLCQRSQRGHKWQYVRATIWLLPHVCPPNLTRESRLPMVHPTQKHTRKAFWKR